MFQYEYVPEDSNSLPESDSIIHAIMAEEQPVLACYRCHMTSAFY